MTAHARPDRPAWLDRLVGVLPSLRPDDVPRWQVPPTATTRQSGVLVLFGEGPDVLLTERAHTLRSHAGQPAFPGGRIDPGDGGPVGAALREAQEEVGLDPGSVEVLGSLPDIWLAASRFVVTPVLAWWRDPHPVGPVDAAEVAAVRRVPIAQLTDPERRVTVTHPSGYEGPGFALDGLLVWGFTAGVLDRVLHLGGWELPWDRGRRQELDAQTVALALRTAEAALPPSGPGLPPTATLPPPAT